MSGFGPPPRTYVVPADRVALTGAYDPDLDALPLVRVAPPTIPVSDLPVANRLRAEGTYGANAGRTGRLDLSAPVASGQIVADVDYDGIGSVDDLDDLAFDRFRVQAGIQSGGAVQFSLGGGALVDRYSLPEVRQLQNLSTSPLRRLTRLTGRVGVERIGASPFELGVRYTADRLAPASDGADVVLGTAQSAGMIEATGSAALFRRIVLDAGAGAVGLDGGLSEDAQFAAGGAAIRLGSAAGAQVLVGARGLGYTVSAENGNGDAVAFSPIVDASLPLSPTLQVFVSNAPRLVVRGLGDVAETNPFVVDRPVVAPDLLRIDARAGVEIDGGPLLLRSYAHVIEAPTWLIFERDASDGRFVEGYESVRIQGVTGEATLITASGVSFDAGLTLRDGEIDGNGGDIPFFAPVVLRGGVQVPFSRGRFSLTALHETERPADRGNITQAPSITQLSADLTIDVTRLISVVAQADRLAGGVEEWP
ncbi:MAG: hypothetical protein AAFQ43_10340, partial [Bacteroidota bacterium]